MGAWLVSLETLHTDDAMRADLSTALASVGGEITSAPGTGRCVVRLMVPGAGPADALQVAMEVWRASVADIGRPGWPVFAADVIDRVDAPATSATQKKSSRRTA